MPAVDRVERRVTGVDQQFAADVERINSAGADVLWVGLGARKQNLCIEEARDNLREALELFFECASPAEIQERMGEDVFVTQVEVAIG